MSEEAPHFYNEDDRFVEEMASASESDGWAPAAADRQEARAARTEDELPAPKKAKQSAGTGSKQKKGSKKMKAPAKPKKPKKKASRWGQASKTKGA